jgi:dolichol-phosphate mannosyltransferase
MIYFMIPMYNEAANLPVLLASLLQWTLRCGEHCHLIAVDDGSTDDTAEILRGFDGLPTTVVRHRSNLGVASAFESGFRAWSELSVGTCDLLVTLEADNTSSLSILKEMVERARAGFDLVLASCYAPGGTIVGTNFVRTSLSFCANLILRCTPGMPGVCTFSSFYRVYRGSFLRRAMAAYGDRMIEETGFVCVVELLLKFGLVGARICEVPLRLDGAQRKGASKMKVTRTIRGYLHLFLRAATGSVAKPRAEAQVSRIITDGSGTLRLGRGAHSRTDESQVIPVSECLERATTSASDSIGSQV